tara:strand:+ start:311 stop:1792 length:1482 start_codon:yes stop_codon:yes gene_type:complete
MMLFRMCLVVMFAGCGGPGGDWSPLVVNDDAPASAPSLTDAGQTLAGEDVSEVAVDHSTDGGGSRFEPVVDGGLIEDNWPVFAGEVQRRYPSDALYLPFSDGQMAHWKNIMNTVEEKPDPVFMKVGASTFAGPGVLHCLDNPEIISLMSEAQAEAITHFSAGDAGGGSPFDRASLAVMSGRTAGWAISGTPSPLTQEIEAIDPQMALVEYGTNDMNMGLTHASAMWGFYDNLNALTESLMAQNILPVLHTIRHRADSLMAGQWVPTYNGIIRGLAQKHQVPFIDQYNALAVLSDDGLVGDGVHASTLASNPCDFTDSGMAYGTNRRNETTLKWMADYFQDWQDGASPAESLPLIPNLGDHEQPIGIDGFPFYHVGNTADSTTSEINTYDACDRDIDESGPEVVYEFNLSAPTAMRLLIFSDPGGDVDIHLLEAPFDGDACLARAHRQLEGTLAPGTYRLVADSYVSGDGAQSGSYLLVALECAMGDESCDDPF